MYHRAVGDERVTETLVMQLFDLVADTQAAIADALIEMGLTDALATALWRLDPDGPPPAMRDLASALHCDPSTVTFLVERLEERGLIISSTSQSDRRVRVVKLTPEGTRSRGQLVRTLTQRSPLARLGGRDQVRLSQLLTEAGANPNGFVCQATTASHRAGNEQEHRDKSRTSRSRSVPQPSTPEP